MKADFYHLTRQPLDAVLPRLAARALEAGYRVQVRAADEAELARLDRWLWTHDETSFLPHGCDGERAAQQPVLLSNADEPANGADLLILAAVPVPARLNTFKRVLRLFDDDGADAARGEWRALPDAERAYWQQDDDGRWQRKA